MIYYKLLVISLCEKYSLTLLLIVGTKSLMVLLFDMRGVSTISSQFMSNLFTSAQKSDSQTDLNHTANTSPQGRTHALLQETVRKHGLQHSGLVGVFSQAERSQEFKSME